MAAVCDSKTRVVFVLGGPGSGKGTNCERIVNEFGFAHLSAGDLLRAERKSGTPLGDEIEKLISEGILVSSDITVRLLREAMEKSESNKFLIDGFPRNAENFEIWNRDMSECIVDFVLVLECPDEVMQERLLSRGQGRSDDNVSAIQNRLKVYHELTQPIIDLYSEKKLTRIIDSEGNMDDVYSNVRDLFTQAEDAQK